MKTYTIPRIKSASICIQYTCADKYSYYINDYIFSRDIDVWCHAPDCEVLFNEKVATLDEALKLIQEHIKERQEQ